MNLFILRHGETEWNIQKRFQGQLDSLLTKRGIEQIEEVGEILRETEFARVYSSEIGRAIKSAEIIISKNKFYKNKGIVKLKELNEINFGEWQGMTFSEVATKYPENNRNYFNDIEKYNSEENGGENLQEGLKRFLRGLEKIREAEKEGNVLVVTHGTVIELFLHYVENKKFDEMGIIKNGKFRVFTYENGEYKSVEAK